MVHMKSTTKTSLVALAMMLATQGAEAVPIRGAAGNVDVQTRSYRFAFTPRIGTVVTPELEGREPEPRLIYDPTAGTPVHVTPRLGSSVSELQGRDGLELDARDDDEVVKNPLLRAAIASGKVMAKTASNVGNSLKSAFTTVKAKVTGDDGWELTARELEQREEELEERDDLEERDTLDRDRRRLSYLFADLDRDRRGLSAGDDFEELDAREFDEELEAREFTSMGNSPGIISPAMRKQLETGQPAPKRKTVPLSDEAFQAKMKAPFGERDVLPEPEMETRELYERDMDIVEVREIEDPLYERDMDIIEVREIEDAPERRSYLVPQYLKDLWNGKKDKEE